MKFLTIRQTAATGIMSEYYLRLLVAQGRCPGIYSGNRFLVNVEALMEQLDAESRRNCGKSQAVAQWQGKKYPSQRCNAETGGGKR